MVVASNSFLCFYCSDSRSRCEQRDNVESQQANWKIFLIPSGILRSFFELNSFIAWRRHRDLFCSMFDVIKIGSVDLMYGNQIIYINYEL
jgi:hypothetical protein